MKRLVSLAFVSLSLCACFSSGREKADSVSPDSTKAKGSGQFSFNAPPAIPREFVEAIDARSDEFLADLDAVLKADSGLLLLVDKKHSLDPDAVPPDLVPLLEGRSYSVGRNGLSLRLSAEAALERMARAARDSGITLVASSSYRSYEYQKKIYERNVLEMGEAAAGRESAKPGQSQHQLGTAVDFGSITDEFAQTRAGQWLSLHAGEYGWSLSFPQGLEQATGYRWECWHYRYIGTEAVALQDKWFGGVQQYEIEFIDAWRKRLDGR